MLQSVVQYGKQHGGADSRQAELNSSRGIAGRGIPGCATCMTEIAIDDGNSIPSV